MRVWIGCLASYNAGKLIGEWLDMEDFDELEEFQEAVRERVLAQTGGEEYHVCDFEDFGSFEVGRYEGLTSIFRKARLLLDSDDLAMVCAGVEVFGEDYVLSQDDPTEWLQDRFCGRHEDEGDYARELTAGCHDIPSYLEGYIDWAALERDMVLNGDVLRVSYGGEHLYFHD